MFNDGEIVELDGRTYLVFRVSNDKGSEHVFVELGIANEKLIDAYYDAKG